MADSASAGEADGQAEVESTRTLFVEVRGSVCRHLVTWFSFRLKPWAPLVTGVYDCVPVIPKGILFSRWQ